MLATLVLTGCAKGTAEPAGTEAAPGGGAKEYFSHVVKQETDYYTSGPQQGSPPDGKFPPGTKVNVRRRTGGYSLVKAQDGTEGYVSSDALEETNPEPAS
jgi:hypothetical protein